MPGVAALSGDAPNSPTQAIGALWSFKSNFNFTSGAVLY